jgi:puromycin-sensitive aminopeptidase
MASEADYRLPRSVIPSAYRLQIAPDIEAATFSGSVEIDVDVVAATDIITLNAIELEISEATLSVSGQDLSGSTTFDEEQARAMFTFNETIQPGAATLSITFAGILNDQLRGFYRSTYTGADGATKTLATTQLEATDARRAFPCWDEPDLKATFVVSLIVPEGVTALSNAAQVSRTPFGSDQERVVFAETMKMSTYLVAFIVGELEISETIDVDGIPLRIITPPGKMHLAPFALDASAAALRYFASYYGVPYPGDKLDMVAIPDFAAGAMENLGCITYRETALLIDDETATQANKMRVAEVIGHEVAHMWFGDLVTMKWWNGIWLNEAFASFAENKFVEHYRPEWQRWLHFAPERARSQETDGLAATRPIEFAVASPDEANEMFDVLTYEKGASVLRMMEQYLGEESFRAGVARYLRRHAYSNTDTADLWAALEAESGEPVGEIMDTWIFQGGYPEVLVKKVDGGVSFEQSHFRYIGHGEGSWQVPVLYRTDDGDGRIVVGDTPVTIEGVQNVVVNAGGEGFYRVEYEHDLLTGVVDKLHDLAPMERFSIVSDTVANVMAGELPASDLFTLVRELTKENEIEVWSAALSGLREIDRIASSDDAPALQHFVRILLEEKVSELGWTPAEGEADRMKVLRGLLLRAFGNLGNDQETIASARSIAFDPDGVDVEVATAAQMVTAAHGDMADFDRFIEMSNAAQTPQLMVKYLTAATQVPHPDVPARLFQMIIDGDIRKQDSFWVAAAVVGTKKNGPRAWQLATERWDELLAALPPHNESRLIDYVQYLSDPDTAASIKSWLPDHPISGGEAAARQRLEMLEIRVGLRNRESDRLGSFLWETSRP